MIEWVYQRLRTFLPIEPDCNLSYTNRIKLFNLTINLITWLKTGLHSNSIDIYNSCLIEMKKLKTLP